MKWLWSLVAILLAMPPSFGSVNGQTVRGTLLENANEFLVAIFFRRADQDWRFICTGSLIHKNFVLTAGHCLHLNGEYAVRFFKWDGYELNLADFLVATEFDRHPDWNKNTGPKGWNTVQDIGLLMIPDAPKWTKPIPFADYAWESQVGDPAAVVSFDRAPSMSGTIDLKDIHRVNLAISVSGPKESTWQGNVIQNKKASFATAVCAGDSGSPVVKVRNGKYFLVGVIMSGTPLFRKPIGKRDGELVYMQESSCGNLIIFYYPDEEILERWMANFPGADNPRVLRIQ